MVIRLKNMYEWYNLENSDFMEQIKWKTDILTSLLSGLQ